MSSSMANKYANTISGWLTKYQLKYDNSLEAKIYFKF